MYSCHDGRKLVPESKATIFKKKLGGISFLCCTECSVVMWNCEDSMIEVWAIPWLILLSNRSLFRVQFPRSQQVRGCGGLPDLPCAWWVLGKLSWTVFPSPHNCNEVQPIVPVVVGTAWRWRSNTKSGEGKEGNCIAKKEKVSDEIHPGVKVREALLSKHHIYPFQRPHLT